MNSAFAAKNITIRAYEVQADLITRAAEKAGKTPSAYGRDILTRQAAKDLGVPVPNLPEMKRGRLSELVVNAAKMTGLTPEEFMRMASERMASAALGYQIEVDHSVPIPMPKGSERPPSRKRRVG